MPARAGARSANAVVVLVAAALVLGPIVALADAAVRDIPGVHSPEHVPWARIGRAAGRTVLQASLSTLAAAVVGLCIALLMARVSASVARLMSAVVLVPFVLPTVVAAAGVLAVGRPWLPRGGSLTAVVIAHAWMNAGLVAVMVAPALSAARGRPADAARSLGAGEVRIYRTIVWPSVAPRLADAALIVFSLCSVAFGTVLILGGPQHATIDVEIWYSVNQALDLRSASIMASLQVVTMFGLVWLRFRSGRAAGFPSSGAHRGTANSAAGVAGVSEMAASRPERRIHGVSWAARLGALAVVAVATAPLVILALRALGNTNSGGRPAAAGLELVSGAGPMLARSAGLAVAVGIFSAVLAAGCVMSFRLGAGRIAERLLLIPLGLSAASTGLGWLLIGQRLGLPGSWALVVAAQGTLAAPFAVSAVLGAARGVSPVAEAAAATLGASPVRVFRTIVWPHLWPALLAGSALAGALALGDLGAASFVVPGDQPTLAIYAAQLLGRPVPGSFEAGLRWSLALGAGAAALAALGTIARSRQGGQRKSGGSLSR